jgi:hypothetical protein
MMLVLEWLNLGLGDLEEETRNKRNKTCVGEGSVPTHPTRHQLNPTP